MAIVRVIHKFAALVAGGWTRRQRSCRRRFWGCLLLLLLLILLTCSLLFWATHQVLAYPEQACSVLLLVDQSHSMWNNADPNHLWRNAARLLVAYLAVEDDVLTHQLGMISFGGGAHLVIPFTSLGNETERSELVSLLSENQGPMDWTDPAAALAEARTYFENQGTSGCSAIIIVTDGKPERSYTPTPAERDVYIARLMEEAEQLAAAEVAVFIVLLEGEAAADDQMVALWRPVWEQLVAANEPGRLYTARRPEELTTAFHDITLALTSGQSAGAIIDEILPPARLQHRAVVEPGLARVTFVISKETLDLAVTILQPDGVPLLADRPGIRHAGEAGVTLEEIWVVDNPPAGEWLIYVTGPGQLTVWQDYRRAASTATPSPTSRPANTPFNTPASSPTVTVRPTVTPQPTLLPTIEVSANPPILAATPVRRPITAGSLLASGPRPYWVCGVIGLVLLAGGGGVLWQRWRNRPVVQGDLRHTVGPRSAGSKRLIELDTLRRSEVVLGLPPADIPLSEVTERITLRARKMPGGSVEILVSGPSSASLDGRPLHREEVLADGSTIVLGPHRLRYENLPLRQGQRSWTSKQKKIISS